MGGERAVGQEGVVTADRSGGRVGYVVRLILYFGVFYLAPFAVIWTGARWYDWVLCLLLVPARVFFVSAGYHRYFSHRGYKMGRKTQFLMALGGTLAAQRGPLWWAATHRHHHRYSDTEQDVHSPRYRGFWWAHMGWILSGKYDTTNLDDIKDFTAYRELRWLDTSAEVPPVLAAVLLLWLGGWGTLLVGALLSTAILYQCTYMVNSVMHMVGTRRFDTGDDSGNSWWVALLSGGDGWHNNHHHYQSTANHGFFKGEIDWSYWILRKLETIGLVWDLRTPPQHVLDSNRLDRAAS